MMGRIERLVQAVDECQQRHRWLAFPVAVVKKFGDDQAGQHAALLAYYGFFSLFPLLLVAVTVVGFVLQGQLGPLQRIVDSALTSSRSSATRSARPCARAGCGRGPWSPTLGGTDKQVLEDLAKQLDDRSPGLAEHALPACPYRSDEGPGPACGREPALPRNAFYCPVGDFIAWDSPA